MLSTNQNSTSHHADSSIWSLNKHCKKCIYIDVHARFHFNQRSAPLNSYKVPYKQSFSSTFISVPFMNKIWIIFFEKNQNAVWSVVTSSRPLAIYSAHVFQPDVDGNLSWRICLEVTMGHRRMQNKSWKITERKNLKKIQKFEDSTQNMLPAGFSKQL